MPDLTVYDKLENAWQKQNSLLCVGLDPEDERLPRSMSDTTTPYFDFCRDIVDATAPYACAFKPQAAHFAAVGREDELAAVIAYVRTNYPDLLVVLDAKRGDVGSTARYYAREAYERYDADVVTLSPYLGYESVEPYLEYSDHGVILLCRTSNADSDWLQNSPQDQNPIYQRVAQRVVEWNGGQQCMLVAGATYPEELGRIRQIVGDMPLLVPGIGAQGGDLLGVMAHGLDNKGTGMLISSSRGILYAERGEKYASAAASAARTLRDEINSYR